MSSPCAEQSEPNRYQRRAAIRRLHLHHGLTVWLTGLSSAGKTTIGEALFHELHNLGYKAEHLDGDIIRRRLSKGLGFSREDREENIRRIGFVAEMLTRHGVIVVVSAIAPYAAMRQELRQRIGEFVEVFVNAPLELRQQAEEPLSSIETKPEPANSRQEPCFRRYRQRWVRVQH